MSKATNVIPFPVQRVSGVEIGPAERFELMAAVDAQLRRKSSSAAEDRIFGYIAHHRHAIAVGHTSDAETYMRCLVIGGATTRKGTIALAKYLAELIQTPVRDGIHLDTQIDGKPWVEVFLNTLARELQRMRSEFPVASKKV